METINFVIKYNHETINSILQYNYPNKLITILTNNYNNNILTEIQSEQMTIDGIVVCGKIDNITTIICINDKLKDNELFNNLNHVFELTFKASNFYFISEHAFLLKNLSLENLLKKYLDPTLSSFIGFSYSDYIQNGNIILCDEIKHNTPFVLIKKDIIAQYKLTNHNISKINRHIGIHIPEPLIEVLDG